MAKLSREEVLAGADMVFKWTAVAALPDGKLPLCTVCERQAIQALRYRNRWKPVGQDNSPIAHTCTQHADDVLYEEMLNWLSREGNHGLIVNPDSIPAVVVVPGFTEETEDPQKEDEWCPAACMAWHKVPMVELSIPEDVLEAFMGTMSHHPATYHMQEAIKASRK